MDRAAKGTAELRRDIEQLFSAWDTTNVDAWAREWKNAQQSPGLVKPAIEIFILDRATEVDAAHVLLLTVALHRSELLGSSDVPDLAAVLMDTLPVCKSGSLLAHLASHYSTYAGLLTGTIPFIKGVFGLRKRMSPSALSDDTLMGLLAKVRGMYLPWTDRAVNNVAGREKPVEGLETRNVTHEVADVVKVLSSGKKGNELVRACSNVLSAMKQDEASFGFPSGMEMEEAAKELFLDESQRFLVQSKDDNVRLQLLFLLYFRLERMLLSSYRTRTNVSTMIRLWRASSAQSDDELDSILREGHNDKPENQALWDAITASENMPSSEALRDAMALIEQIVDDAGYLTSKQEPSAFRGIAYSRGSITEQTASSVVGTERETSLGSFYMRPAALGGFTRFHPISGSKNYVNNSAKFLRRGGTTSFYKQLRELRMTELRWTAMKVLSFKHTEKRKRAEFDFESQSLDALIENAARKKRPSMKASATLELDDLFNETFEEQKPREDLPLEDQLSLVNAQVSDLSEQGDDVALRRAQERQKILLFKQRRQTMFRGY